MFSQKKEKKNVAVMISSIHHDFTDCKVERRARTRRAKCISRLLQGLNLRGNVPMDFKSITLTTRSNSHITMPKSSHIHTYDSSLCVGKHHTYHEICSVKAYLPENILLMNMYSLMNRVFTFHIQNIRIEKYKDKV